MNYRFKFLLLGVFISLGGFIIGGVLKEKEIGMILFFFGFAIGVVSAIFIVLFRDEEKLPDIHISMEIKLAAIGFGLVVLGKLVNGFFEQASVIGDFSFFSGFLVVIVGIIMAIIKKIKEQSGR